MTMRMIRIIDIKNNDEVVLELPYEEDISKMIDEVKRRLSYW